MRRLWIIGMVEGEDTRVSFADVPTPVYQQQARADPISRNSAAVGITRTKVRFLDRLMGRL
jgi:hypothetical protein